MVNQAFRIKIAYRSEKKKKKEEENTRDRSVPDGSDNEDTQTLYLIKNIEERLWFFYCTSEEMITIYLGSLPPES